MNALKLSLSRVLLLLGLVMLISGCQEGENPTAADVLRAKPTATPTPSVPLTQPADDTSTAGISSPPYPAGTTVIAAVGDSITYGTGTWTGGYPAILQTKLQTAGYQAVVINQGIPGEYSASTAARFLNVIAGANIVLLMIGMNDISNPRYCPVSFDCNTIGHIEAMLDKALISKVTPLVSTVTPKQIGSSSEHFNSDIQQLNTAIAASAAARKVILADNYTALMNNGNPEFYVDVHHLDDRGNAVLAQTWYDALANNKLIKLPGQK